MRWLYRARQFWRALTASLGEAELAQVRQFLSPPLLSLFLSQQPSEQAHSYRMFQQLVEQGEGSTELLAAALLHDVGKSRLPLRAWERVAVVVGQSWFPRLALRLGRDERRGWRPFITATHHAAWGAEMAARAGANRLTVALIRRHQDLPGIPAVLESQASPAVGELGGPGDVTMLLLRLPSVDQDN